MVFRSDADKYLRYDYVGAPWDAERREETGGPEVGNGGFSLRTRRVVRRCCELYAQDPAAAARLAPLARPLSPGAAPAVPEDVVVVRMMTDCGLGGVAPASVADSRRAA